MFNKLIDKHLQELTNEIDDNTIVVYKGFPISFLRIIFDRIPPVVTELILEQ